ncbi:hypothetical protein BUALT_Bualt18G0113100 [Buddleja alternifolia]|uniref:Diacylglycerol O-acyltransferase 3, cytosolic n=1 Tax=Buddleja alternifolia TaxID=168488 RepID=A0AAV6W2Y5_9LAMI|nr:hypothetical protein BUALT_Bualt18G0113100 [Buddleja alternifolia]
MEASGVVLRQPVRFTSSLYNSPSKELKNSIFRRPRREVLKSGFYDQGHLKYYNCNCGPNSAGGMSVISDKMKGVKKMKKKKQLKLLKGLSKDLSTFSQMGFGLDFDSDENRALVDQIKGNMISEAAELLLEQLQKLKAEEKELKRKMNEEKRRLKAANTCEMSSSSSSSESSDSDCGEVVDMKNLKKAQKTRNPSQQVVEEASSSYPTPVIPIIPESMQIKAPCNIDNESIGSRVNSGNLGDESENSLVSTNCSKKIEVCMGGKCKKSGAATLLEEFQRVVGIEGAVSGCKCMGKCRDGPNIKVLNEIDGGTADDNSVSASTTTTNSLCIGVGLEDVNMIVANFLGENSNQLGFAAAN